jgi:HK97 family phage prohead protease
MMQIRIKKDRVEIEGYVNAIERKSKPLWSRMGQFLERICKGAFNKALSRNDNVRILLNHDWNRDLGGQKDGNLELCEDSIGLRARATITDADVVQKAKEGKLVGWSFGFYDRDVLCHTDEDGMPLRDVRDLDLEEVSLLDDTKTPAYDGTLVMVRADNDKSIFFGETFADEIQIREETTEVSTEETTEDVPKQQETVEKNINYDEWDSLIADMKK